MKLDFRTILSSVLLLLTMFSAEALSQTGRGTLKVYVKLQFKNEKTGGVLPNEKSPTNMQIFFQSDLDRARVRVEQDRGEGFFRLEGLQAGKYLFAVEIPDKKYCIDPPSEVRNGDLIFCRQAYCQMIEVLGDRNQERVDIIITLSDKAFYLARLKQKPELKITVINATRASYNRKLNEPRFQADQREKENKGPVQEIRGKVLDHAQKPLPKALVELSIPSKNVADECELSAVTNDSGEYTIQIPQACKQETVILSISKEGYQPQSILMDWGELPGCTTILGNVVSPQPRAGDESDPVALPPLEAARRYAFSQRLMQSLPIRGYRSFDELALLAPGVLPPPQTHSDEGPGVSPGVGTAGQFSVNGMRSRENNFAVDGSDNNDEDIGTRRQGFVALAPQPIETLQEFQIITALADANYGRNIGGQVNALTQAGSRSFHASVYGFYTDNSLNARNFFDHTAQGRASAFTLTRAVDNAPVLLDNKPLTFADPAGGENLLRRTQAGFLIDGHIPHTAILFFTSMERKVNHEDRESHFAVPTVKQRGVFETGDTGFRAGGASFFPASVPGDAIFSLYPFPNNPVGPYGQNTYTAVLPADGDATLFTTKMARRFGDWDQQQKRPWWGYLPVPMNGDILTGRFNLAQDADLIPVTGQALFSSLRPKVRTQNWSFFLNRRLSNHSFDTIRFSFGRTRLFLLGASKSPLSSSFDLPKVPLLLNAPLLLNVTAPQSNGKLGAPAFVSASSPQGAALLASLGYKSVTNTQDITGPIGQVWIPGFSPVGIEVSFFPQTRANNTIQVADTLRITRGNHAYTLGGDIRRVQVNSSLEKNFRPFAQFDSLINAGPTLPLTRDGSALLPQQLLTGATLAAAGAPTGFFHTIGIEPDSFLGIRYTQVNLFAQDEWNIRPDLQLTLGARYEANPIPDTVHKQLEKALDPARIKRLAQEAAVSCASRCGDLVEGLTSALSPDFKVSFGNDRSDIDVRLGFAYELFLEPLLRPNKSGNQANSATRAGRVVLRGGFGIYSGQFNGIILSQSRNAFPNFIPLNLANFSARLGDRSFLFNPANPNLQPPNSSLDVIRRGTLNTFQGSNPVLLLSGQQVDFQALSLAPVPLGLDPLLPQQKLRGPYAMHYGIAGETNFYDDYSFSFSYVGTRGVKLLRIATPDLGTNNSRVTFANVTPLGSSAFPHFSGSQAPAQSLTISNSFTIARTFYESSASSTYHSFQMEVRKRYERHLEFGSVLTYSHSLDDASDFFDTAGAFALPQSSRQSLEKASSSYDVRWRWVSHVLWDISSDFPGLGKGLGGWRIASIITAATGQPFTINSAFDVNRDGNLTDRLDTTNGIIVGRVKNDSRVLLHLDDGVAPSSLLAPDGSDGAIGRNTFRAPGVLTLDLAVIKNLNFDNQKFHIRAEIFNLFNRTHFAIPDRILESSGFGKAVRTLIPARTLQFAFKYSF